MQATHCYSSTIKQRLDAKCVVTDGGCIEFVGARTDFGYGRIGRGGRGTGWEATHRVAWQLENGPIPDGLFVCHKCDNPPCCNVDHLFLGTPADNMLDMVSKGRGRRQIEGGEGHRDARLADEDVARLRDLAPFVGNYAELGRIFGITKQHARALVLNMKRAA
jgi:hypothetical protein